MLRTHAHPVPFTKPQRLSLNFFLFAFRFSFQVHLETGKVFNVKGQNLQRSAPLLVGDVVRVHGLKSRGVEYNGAYGLSLQPVDIHNFSLVFINYYQLIPFTGQLARLHALDRTTQEGGKLKQVRIYVTSSRLLMFR